MVQLPIIEEFYTIQGEGYHAGKPAYFIRLGGCDIGCSWCDTKYSWNFEDKHQTYVDDLVERVKDIPSKAIVITGGEPLTYNLDYLCNELKLRGITTFLETSGAYPLSGKWDWICLSPKKQNPPQEAIFSQTSELKVIIFKEADLEWAEENAKKVGLNCKLYLQAEWSRFDKLIPLVTNYAKQNPRWSISIQSHKFMKIP